MNKLIQILMSSLLLFYGYAPLQMEKELNFCFRCLIFNFFYTKYYETYTMLITNNSDQVQIWVESL